MKTPIKQESMPILGVDDQIPPAERSATNIVNMTLDERTKGWDSRVGYEKFFTNASTSPYGKPFDSVSGYAGPIQSLYSWTTNQGAKQFYVYEVSSPVTGVTYLQYLSVAEEAAVTIESDRATPVFDQAPTDYEPYGRWLIILNGQDRAIKFDSVTGNVTDLGWNDTPSAPDPWPQDEDGTLYSGTTSGIVIDIEGGNLGSPHSLSTTRVQGLGSTTKGAVNSYRWKVSFINETGSESPLSVPSDAAQWTTEEITSGSTFEKAHSLKRRAVYLEGIPRGPKGTVARKIYRTRNVGDLEPGVMQDLDTLYYHVSTIHNNRETNYVDYTPDNFLGMEAPTTVDSILMPAPGARSAAAFQGRLFITGGYGNAGKIYYSQVGQPDTYGALDYFNVGTRDGGGVTALFPYYNELIVFRERAIDVIRNMDGTMVLTPFLQGIGTRAVQSITSLPGAGVVFLADDGVYLLSGGMVGGAELSVNKISAPIMKTIKRMSPSAVPRATAAYSPKWREWHCYFAADGAEKPSIGIVFHLDSNGWSIRENFPVGCIVADKSANLVFGNHTGRPYPRVEGDQHESGLFVISRNPYAGHTITLTPAGGPDQSASESTGNGPAVTSKFKSRWHDFGYPSQKKHIKYLYLYVLTKGDNTIPVTVFEDFSSTGTALTPTRVQRPEHPDQDVFGTGVWDSAVWQEQLITELRYAVSQKACSRFAFEIETGNDFVLLGYSLELAANEMRTGRGKVS
tara:strand:+ start:3600 stop:5810 length:2211 start_codon:yes stop_codon:yes gene_type:complete